VDNEEKQTEGCKQQSPKNNQSERPFAEPIMAAVRDERLVEILSCQLVVQLHGAEILADDHLIGNSFRVCTSAVDLLRFLSLAFAANLPPTTMEESCLILRATLPW
jgi:hypothetical protein